MDTTDEWITERTGIKEEGTLEKVMVIQLLQWELKAAKIAIEELELIKMILI